MQEPSGQHHIRASVAKVAASENSTTPVTTAVAPRVQSLPDSRADRAKPDSDQPLSSEVAPSSKILTAAPMVAPAAESAPAPQRVAAPDVAAVVREVVEAAERMRIGGRDRVELQVQLHGGEEVTIKLQLREGKVQAVFRTESDPLRQALEQNWPQLSQRPGERIARIATTVFETSQSNSGMSDFPSRQERRQASEQAPDAAPLPRMRRAPNAVAPVRATQPLPESVQLYA